jgi:hypothetical protein
MKEEVPDGETHGEAEGRRMKEEMPDGETQGKAEGRGMP